MTSPHQPQMTHVFADGRIELLCHALRICVTHAPSESGLTFLFICLHRILRCLSSYCIPYAIIKCQMTMLRSYFPGLAARVFPPENCLIHPLASLFAYLRILNSLIRQNVDSLIHWFSSLAMRFHSDQEGCCPCGNFFVSMWMAAAQILRQVPPLILPFHLH